MYNMYYMYNMYNMYIYTHIYTYVSGLRFRAAQDQEGFAFITKRCVGADEF